MRLKKRFIRSRRTYKDSTPEENLQAGKAAASEQDVGLFNVREGLFHVPRELHELARHINSRSIDREDDFIRFDYHLCRLSHARSLVDLCLGELLGAFRHRDGKAYGEMGYSKLDDFADEHLSFSGRLASEMILNFERLQALPLTREAYVKGEIVKSALRLLLRVATKENEDELLAEIRELSVREIDRLVKAKSAAIKVGNRQKNNTGGYAEGQVTENAGAAGYSAVADATSDSTADMIGQVMTVTHGGGSEGAPVMAVAPGESSGIASPAAGARDETVPGLFQEEQAYEEQESEEMPSEEADRDEGSGVVMKFNVPHTLALTWDFALEHFKENDKTNGPLYGFVEALVSSFLDSTADLVASRGLVHDGEANSEKGSASSEEPEGDTGAVSESGPAFVGGREVPLLYAKAFCDDIPGDREMRVGCGDGSLESAEPGDCRTPVAADEYPDPQNEERLKQIREELLLQPFIVKLPEEYSQIPGDSHALAQKIIRVAQMRQSIDYHIGWFLKAVHDRHLFRLMEFSKIEDYAKARINISASTTFRLIRLVSYFSNHPVIEKAFLRRKITREQAYQIASLEDGRHEKIWLDFAMSRPARELRGEISRILRIKEYDYFASHNYALLPGFRYITDDRYDELSDEMKDILRTGAWYKGPGSQWPLPSHDEHLLDKGFADAVASQLNMTQLSKCAAENLEETDPAESSRLSKCAPDHLEESGLAEPVELSKCAPEIETGAFLCREREDQHSDETIEQARALCTLPDKHRPAATLLLDVLESLGRRSDGNASSSSSDSKASAESDVSTASDISAIQAAGGFRSSHGETAMSIRFFMPRGLYGVWNEAVRRYVSLISPDDGVELLINNDGVENLLALLLTQYLLTEKAHHKAAQNNKVLERDGYKCQVPGCSNRRNIHAHHLEFRSQGGCNASHNLLSLCAAHHLWILHILHGLKVEGKAPDDLTFTFGPCSSPEGQPFMIYSGGRKVLSPEPEAPPEPGGLKRINAA
jgi:hypothetical protein